jgi:uncharacterized membrane protein YedE/YeeE
MVGMSSYLLFLTVYLHATGLAWDEIIPITLIGLTIVAGLILFLLARRFKPGDEESEPSDNG